MMIGIDFTKSNEYTSWFVSSHIYFKDPKTHTPYQRAIKAVT